MLIKGEKYACEACVRGHRVTNCQHTDRPLQHINKKGRPVSQCSHCRTLRKSRSAHVRCDCGEKAQTKVQITHGSDSQADDCCCGHGGRCSCALKKEHLDPVPESDSDEASSSAVTTSEPLRPRAVTSTSDTGLTVFTNGHHKPGHKHNNMAHKSGLPYVVPRAHSIHGTSPSSLLANRSVDSLPHTSSIDALHSESIIKDSMVSAQQEQRMVKSENGSPLLNTVSNLDQLNGMLPPLDLSSLPADYEFLQTMDCFSGLPDQEQPLFSAGLSTASIDWSHYDGLDFNNDGFATSSYSQAASFNGFDFSGAEVQPALTTTSTSGEISEVEDFPTFDQNLSATRPSLLHNQYGSDISDLAGDDRYRLSAASSYIGMMSAAPGNVDLQAYAKNESAGNGFPIDYNDDMTSFLPPDSQDDFWYNDLPPDITISTRSSSETQGEEAWAQ